MPQTPEQQSAQAIMQTQDETKGMAWWNGLSDEQRKEWMARAGNTGVAADAWAAFKTATLAEVTARLNRPGAVLNVDMDSGLSVSNPFRAD